MHIEHQPHRAATEEALAARTWEYVEALEELVRMAERIEEDENDGR